jgi:hypothetical protein
VGVGEGWVEIHRALEHPDRALEILRTIVDARRVVESAQICLVGLHVLGGTGVHRLALGLEEGDPQLIHHPLRDLGLHVEDVVGPVVAIGPQV